MEEMCIRDRDGRADESLLYSDKSETDPPQQRDFPEGAGGIVRRSGKTDTALGTAAKKYKQRAGPQCGKARPCAGMRK